MRKKRFPVRTSTKPGTSSFASSFAWANGDLVFDGEGGITFVPKEGHVFNAPPFPEAFKNMKDCWDKSDVETKK